MLDQNDIKQIGSLLQEKLQETKKEIVQETKKEIVAEVSEFIEQQVLPQLDTLRSAIAALPDKDFVSRKAEEIKGTVVAKLRTEDQKVNLLIRFLREQKVLTEEQWKSLRELEVFPSVENLAV